MMDVPIGSLRELGLQKSGPAALAFLDWIAAQAEGDGIEHVLFTGRSGHLLHALAVLRETLPQNPALPDFSHLPGAQSCFTLATMTEANYAAHLPFLTSRSAGLSPFELLERIGAEVPAAHVLQDFGIPDRDILPAEAPRRVLEFLLAWNAPILKLCRRNKRGLLRRLIGCGLRPGDRIALVEIGWDGATQEAFEAATRELMTLNIVGYQFCLAESEACREHRRRMRMKSFIGPQNLSDDMLAAICTSQSALELFLGARAPVIGYWDAPGEAAAIAAPGTAEASAAADAVEAGILGFARQPQRAPQGTGTGDPLRMAMPLLEFIAARNWMRHPELRQIRNFDPWIASRNRDIWLREEAAPGIAGALGD